MVCGSDRCNDRHRRHGRYTESASKIGVSCGIIAYAGDILCRHGNGLCHVIGNTYFEIRKNSLLDNPPQTKSGKTLLFTLIIVAGLCGMIKNALKIIQIKTREGFYNVGK